MWSQHPTQYSRTFIPSLFTASVLPPFNVFCPGIALELASTHVRFFTKARRCMQRPSSFHPAWCNVDRKGRTSATPTPDTGTVFFGSQESPLLRPEALDSSSLSLLFVSQIPGSPEHERRCLDRFSFLNMGPGTCVHPYPHAPPTTTVGKGQTQKLWTRTQTCGRDPGFTAPSYKLNTKYSTPFHPLPFMTPCDVCGKNYPVQRVARTLAVARARG
ncbi:hypothetical protein K491DRAFT_233678 [Lophiostoma macrostomum CBS 122681]|uniref:Uncharacterized protein n=1 Tax=Lophiostoma macrostomum CBS 122681 TaxID=1314788 RepID=A0A6A6SQ05_9PLEO|nr:hypothetical protein K491DRAFT_233678 [Lophiostoma macrostomum CBS 122681]